jgi:hypothetical protein
MLSDKVSEKLLKLDSSKEIIRETAVDEVDKIICAAKEGDQSALRVIASLLPEGVDIEQVFSGDSFRDDLAKTYAEANHFFNEKDAAKKKKKSKLMEVEERILHFCTKPRVSSSVIGLFPARPFNILAIMENLRHKGMLILASNKWVTNIENRDFVPTMVMTAEKKAGQFESKTAEMWAYSDMESKKRLLARAKIKSADKYASEEWDFLPNWIKKSIAYVHENPAVSIAEKKKTADNEDGASDYEKALWKREFEESEYSKDLEKSKLEEHEAGLNAPVTDGSDEKKEAETGEVKKDVPFEITHIQDIDTGEKITDPKLIAEGMVTGMDYIVSFKREGKTEQALLSSLDKSKLAVDSRDPMSIYELYKEQLDKLSDTLQFALKDFEGLERDMGPEYFITVAKLSTSYEHLQRAVDAFESAVSDSSVKLD